MTNGVWITDPSEIKQEAAKFFEKKYKECWQYRPLFRSSDFPAKTKDPIHFGDYRPISLIGSTYKIIAKLLALRLKNVIGSVIDEVQSAAPMIINGSPTNKFSMEKGVRQGDPLSPFLFIIAMEVLNMAMKTTVEKGVFDGIKFPNSNICLSHLFYANDALFIGEWTRRNIANLARILRCFYAASRLKVNFSQSKVFGVGASPSEVSNWAPPLSCESSSLPFTYLGIPVGENMT
uniref:Reverse transcriptase domain-containing protein n=1 Tax=Lactuca sativa TaxID=4236 RepID=A0A9R1WX92_LACSA|nr:hypothetical protein LSAT_V11C800414270 [Lactuca sativa]